MKYIIGRRSCSNLIEIDGRYKVLEYTKDWVRVQLNTGYVHQWWDRIHGSDGFSYYFGDIDPRKPDSLNTNTKVI